MRRLKGKVDIRNAGQYGKKDVLVGLRRTTEGKVSDIKS